MVPPPDWTLNLGTPVEADLASPPGLESTGLRYDTCWAAQAPNPYELSQAKDSSTAQSAFVVMAMQTKAAPAERGSFL